MSGAPWQVYIASQWIDIDQSISSQVESAFVAGSAPIIQVNNAHWTQMPGGIQRWFDVDAMQLYPEGVPVRRSASNAVNTTVHYWGDDDWYQMDAYATCLIHTATLAGRQRTAIYIGNTAYDLFLQPGNEKQTNRDTGHVRPLLIKGVSATGVFGLTANKKDNFIADDLTMPAEYRCPITQMVMQMPVVATDGHSYEYTAFKKWMSKKQTSPVTGAPLPSPLLIINHNLKKLIRDWKNEKTLKDDDLFGDSDDDGMSHVANPNSNPNQDQSSGAGSSLEPKPKRMKRPVRKDQIQRASS